MINHISIKTIEAPVRNWKPANLARISQRFEERPPQELLRWALATYSDDMVVATGFGGSGIVQMHMISQIRPKTTFFYLQTDLLFPETLALRDELAARLGIQFTEVHSGLSLGEQAFQYGRDLWTRNPDLCCLMRKVEPMKQFLADKRAWVTAIRRDQAPSRAETQLVDWDSTNGLIKLAPLAAWTKEQVWDYIEEHQLPYNALRDEGYGSIGCMPCTRPLHDGETDERAGRWAGTDKIECGLHIQPDGTVVRASQVTVTDSMSIPN
jgi:phosphoadenosine phosphosulfate reductase